MRTTQPFIHTRKHKEEHLKKSEISLAKRSEIKIKTLQHGPSIKSQGFRHHLHPKRKKKGERERERERERKLNTASHPPDPSLFIWLG